MKWSHVLSEQLGLLPFSLQQASISYKKWKKYTKNCNCEGNIIVRELETDCKAKDEQFKKAYSVISNRSCFSTTYFSKDDIKLFVDLNKTSIYKVCKRIDKKISPTPGAKKWLQESMTFNMYQFMGGWRLTSLSISLPVECPLCLDRSERVALSKCGHFMCTGCLFKFYELGKYKGTLQNVISHCDNMSLSRCPICRTPRPYSKVQLLPKGTLFVSIDYKNHIRH